MKDKNKDDNWREKLRTTTSRIHTAFNAKYHIIMSYHKQHNTGGSKDDCSETLITTTPICRHHAELRYRQYCKALYFWFITKNRFLTTYINLFSLCPQRRKTLGRYLESYKGYEMWVENNWRCVYSFTRKILFSVSTTLII